MPKQITPFNRCESISACSPPSLGGSLIFPLLPSHVMVLIDLQRQTMHYFDCNKYRFPLY